MDERYTIRMGDCIELMRELPDESIDMILTDPPYGVNYKTSRRVDRSHKFTSCIANDENLNILESAVPEMFRVLKQESAAYIFASPKMLGGVEDIVLASGFAIKNCIVWVKNNHTSGDLTCQYGQKWEALIYATKGRCPIRGKRISDVWNFDRVAPQRLVHQNEKPVGLLAQAIEKSAPLYGVVLDPFMGSGSTGVACAETGRRFIGFELDPEYFEVASNRLSQRLWFDVEDVTQ